ncbi:protein FAR1-RELATED SEQUENCE 5-like [Triticum aestivum]|uniref:protein FAR1-RELATED SEQUENCE 5-like n=1 Tax=Triticum aestivum TaxID=4565 RepID=UPI001D02BB72|nr:protein FAR1-RELATED SEQUENCE 5-like [Triticum aestivum]
MAKTTSILQDMSATDPDFKVCVQVDGESRVKTVIWCNGKNRLDYAHFGDVVTFDTTYRTNLYNMPFGLFVGVNNHFQSIIFGGVLMVDEKTPTFEWAFRNFIDLMDGKHPTTILTDQCKAMQNALRSTMPHTRHRWCRWHVLKVLKEKTGHVYNKHSAFKKEFHAIVNEETDVESFERMWHQLIKKYKLQGNKYLRRIFKWRDMWAMPYFLGTFCAGMTSTQRSESANHLLKKFISRSSPMHLFVKQYNKLLDSRSQAEDEANYVSKQVFTVKVEDGGDFVTCDCGFFDHVGLLCCHSLKVLVQNNIGKIPPRNIVKRWTLWARESRPLHLANEGEMGELSSQTTYRRNVLYVAAMDLIKEAESGSESFQTAFAAICEAKEKIASKKASDMLIDTIAEQANPVRHTITDIGAAAALTGHLARPNASAPPCAADHPRQPQPIEGIRSLARFRRLALIRLRRGDWAKMSISESFA